MSITIPQADAEALFDLPNEVLFVCDGKRECAKPSCSDFGDRSVCHHTADYAHALYDVHYMAYFTHHPAVRNGSAAIIHVEPIRE